MAVLGRVLIGSQQRVDLTDFLAIDSYVGGDLKYLIQSLTATPMVLKGFEVIDAPLSIGASSVSIKVADSVVYFPSSSAGCFYYGLPEGNALSIPLVPELRVNATNYVYLTLTTEGIAQDSRAFWDVDLNGGEGGEFSQDVNTESVLKAQIGVSVSTFPEGSVPLCKITLNATVITSIEDCRNMMFRLGKGGVSPDPFYSYAWKNEPSVSYARNETPGVITSSAQPTPFSGGDKNISSLKEWMDAVMSKLLEISGTTFWYEGTSGASIPSIFDDSLSSTIKSKGKWTHSGTTPGLVTWSEDIIYKKINDPRDIIIRENGISGAQLANEQVLYIKMERDESINNLNAAVNWQNGSVFVNGVAGNFELLRKGDWIKKQSDDSRFYYRVEELYSGASGSGSSGVAGNVALSIRLSSAYTGVTEVAVANRTKGEFTQSPAEYTIGSRDDAALAAAGGDAYWLALRSDSILNLSLIDTVYFGGTVNISDSDGIKAKLTFPSAHGLNDGERIVVAGAGSYNGTYAVEVSSSTEVYIATTAVTNPTGVTASWAVVTTSARTNGYSYTLESANHGFATGETVRISGTSTSYDTYSDIGPGLYELSVRNATQFQIPYNANTSDVVNAGQATVARVILRTEFGSISVVQGESVDIGGDIQNLMDFIGMTSMSQSNPLYAIPGDTAGQTLLVGSQDYNSVSTDSLTTRVSRLTGMMMGRVQDRGLAFNGRLTVRNTTSGGDQVLTISGSQFLSKPGSPEQTISYSGSYNLAANTALVIILERDGSGSISPTVESLGSPFVLAENKLVLYSRFGTTSVYAWDGTEIVNSSSYTVGSLEDSQSKNLFVQDLAGMKLDPLTGVFSFNNTLANIILHLPGASSTSNTINVAAIAALTSVQRTIPSGSCVWVRVNRRVSKTFTTTTTSPTYQDSDVAGALYITTMANVPVDQDVFVLYTNQSGALLAPWNTNPVGNVYEEDKVVVSGPPANDNEVSGPVISGSIISIPFDSRNFEEIQYYVVGSGQLEVYLSGQRLRLNEDWLEVGATGTLSTQIQIQQDLVIGDVLTFRIGTTGAVYFTTQPPSSASMQTAYDNGNIINVNTGSPVTINGTSGKLLSVNGDMYVAGVIDPKGIEFTREGSDPLTSGSDGLWVDSAGHLIQKRGASPNVDITEAVLNPSYFVTAGDGLSWSGSTLNANVDTTSGLDIVADEVSLIKNPAGAITGDATTGIGVNLEPSNASLEINTNQLRLKRRTDSGLSVDSNGTGINLEAVDPSLQISSNELGVKLNASGAIIKDASGVGVQLEAANPSLQISSNRLGAKLNPNGAIASGVNGLGLQIDTSLNITGNTLGVSNVGTILVDLTNNTGSTVAAGTPVAADTTTGNFILANAGSLASAQRYIGVTYASIANTAVGKVQIGGLVTVPSASFVVGQPVYLSDTPGVFTTTTPTATGAAILIVGVATAVDKFVMSPDIIAVKGNIYEETLNVVGTVTVGTPVTLPVDSRDGSSSQNYLVGSGDLEVFLNGQKMTVSSDYTEVGAINTFSTSIQFTQDLVDGDAVFFRVSPTQTSYGGGSLTDPMTSAGDLLYRNVSNVTSRLPAGTTGQVLQVTAPGVVAWANNPSGFIDPMTTAGDFIYKNSSGTTTRLPLGTIGQVLTVTGAGTAAWSSPAAVSQEILLENNSGSTIPAFTPVRADSNGDMDVIDVSVEIESLAIVGITKTSVPDAAIGSMVTSGKLENVTGSFTFGNVLYVSKTGGLTATPPSIGVDGFLAGDWIIKLGVVTKNQSNPLDMDLICQIQVIGQL
jgi:Avian adenovirus fibre, N-terminal